jgi:hypothetical protein
MRASSDISWSYINKLLFVLLVGFSFVPVVLITTGVWLFLNARQHYNDSAKATGSVIEVRRGVISRTGMEHSRAARVRFETANGESLEFTDRSYRYKAGDEVTVLYDPRNPRGAEIHDPGWWVLPSILFSLGALFGMVILKNLRPWRWVKGRDEDSNARMTWLSTSRRLKLPQ